MSMLLIPDGNWILVLGVLTLYTIIYRIVIHYADSSNWYINFIYIIFVSMFAYIGCACAYYIYLATYQGPDSDEIDEHEHPWHWNSNQIKYSGLLLLGLSAVPHLLGAVFVFVLEGYVFSQSPL